MNTIDCIKGRRSIRKFKRDKISHSTLESIISISSFLHLGRTHRSLVILQLKTLLLFKKLQMNLPQILMRILLDKFLL